jgi:multiple antibiotic resistance protein
MTTALGTFVSLLPITNPFSAAVVFLAIARRFTPEQQKHQATMACIYMAAVLGVFLFAGALIMSFFGISIAAVRIAGGLIVARIGFGMLDPEPGPGFSEESREEALHMTDIAFTPLAMPMMSGPGSIAVTLGMAAGAETVGEYLAIGVGIVLVAIVSLAVLRAARRIVALLGVTGLNALTRIMGFLLVCVGIQFVGIGVVEGLSSEDLLGRLLETWQQRPGR